MKNKNGYTRKKKNEVQGREKDYIRVARGRMKEREEGDRRGRRE